MPGLFAELGLLFAQEAGDGLSNLMIYMMPLPILIYFAFIRPQQQMERQRRELMAALKKNDKVITTGGIYGTIVSVDAAGDKVVLRVDDDKGVKLTISRANVGRIVEPKAEKSAETA